MMDAWSRRGAQTAGALVVLGATVLLLSLIPGPVLEKIAGYLMFGMALPATGFPLLYLTFYWWYRKPIGRALMTKAIGLALLVDISVIYAIFGDDYPYRDAVKVLVFALVFVGLWYQFIVFLKIRIETWREEQGSGPRPGTGRHRETSPS